MTDGQVRVKVYDPTGLVETTLLHAPRLDTLAGKTICELSNYAWEHHRIFPVLREALQKQYPTAKFVPYDEAFSSRSELENFELVGKVVKQKGCDAVIAGIAG